MLSSHRATKNREGFWAGFVREKGRKGHFAGKEEEEEEEEEEAIEKVAWLADSGNKEEDGGKEEEGTMFCLGPDCTM